MLYFEELSTIEHECAVVAKGERNHSQTWESLPSEKICTPCPAASPHQWHDASPCNLSSLSPPALLTPPCIRPQGSSGPSEPLSRGGATLTAVGAKLVLIGGASRTGQHFSDVWVYDPATSAWTQQFPSGMPPPTLSGHSAVAMGDQGDQIYLFGGQNGAAGEMYNHLFVLDCGTRMCDEMRE